MTASSHIKKGDIVTVISGDADKLDASGNVIRTGIKGKSGKVLQVLPRKGRVVIEGLRMIKKHQRATQQNQQGGIQEREGSIHISKVRLAEDSAKAKKEKPEAKAKKPAKAKKK
jgi:large subunit ribosomal protein L24